jgi:hypothetical protein
MVGCVTLAIFGLIVLIVAGSLFAANSQLQKIEKDISVHSNAIKHQMEIFYQEKEKLKNLPIGDGTNTHALQNSMNQQME